MNSKEKGKRGERELAKKLREYEVDDRGADQEYPEELYPFIDGTRFFCIR